MIPPRRKRDSLAGLSSVLTQSCREEYQSLTLLPLRRTVGRLRVPVNLKLFSASITDIKLTDPRPESLCYYYTDVFFRLLISTHSQRLTSTFRCERGIALCSCVYKAP